MACSCVGTKILQQRWEGPFRDGVWPCLDPWDGVRLHTASTCWNVPGKCELHEELFFFFIKKEPVVASNDVSPNPFVSAETLKACALIGLHLLSAEGEAGSSGSQSPDLGDVEIRLPKRPGKDQLLFGNRDLPWL